MSKATTDLHSNIKKPGTIIIESLIVLFGFTIFPGGLLLTILFNWLNSIVNIPELYTPTVILAIGVTAALYNIIESINNNMEIHRRVIIELLKTTYEVDS